jgi:excisionase family DNA binding protein
VSTNSKSRNRRREECQSAIHGLPDRLLDVAEAAATLGLKSPRTLYKWAYAGRIPTVRIGRLLRFRRSDLARLIANGERPAFAAPNVFSSTASALGQ